VKNKLWKILTEKKSIKLGGHNIAVIFPYHFKESRDCVGQYDGVLMELRIAQLDSNGLEIPKSAVLATFMHECFHAICGIFGGKIDILDDENLHDSLSQGIYQLFIDNCEDDS